MRRFVGFEKGINLGGWLSQTELTREHMDTFITEEDFRNIKAMGLDHVRLPIDICDILHKSCILVKKSPY